MQVPSENAKLYAEDNFNSTVLSRIPESTRHAYAHFMGNRMCVFVSTPVRGGGTVALWRVVKLFSMSRINLQECNAFSGGWNPERLSQMLTHEMKDLDTKEGNATQQIVGKVGQFDAVVLRIQLGWMKPPAITQEGINETITLCRDYIGAQTVVIMTINFTNDVHNPSEWRWARGMNNNIRELAKAFNQNSRETGSNFRVLIMEFSTFTTQVHWANARQILTESNQTFAYPNIGTPNVSLPDYDQTASFLFDRFAPWHLQDRHPQSIPTVCSRMTGTYFLRGERRGCVRNAIMSDGLHW